MDAGAIVGGILSTLVGAALFVGLIALIVYLARVGSRQSAERRAAIDEHIRQITHDPLTPISVPELMLSPGEAAYYVIDAGIIGHHTRTRRISSGGGPSIRIAKGLYLHGGSYQSESFPIPYTSVDDNGQLIVTNQRLIFIGAKNSYSWALAKIISIHPFTDGVQVNPDNKKPVLFQTGSAEVAVMIDRARTGTLTKSLDSTS